MVMALPRPSTVGSRPAYPDSLYKDGPSVTSPRFHSANSSVSTNASSDVDLRLNRPLPPRPLSPAFEEEYRGSVRSLRLNLSPRFNVQRIFNRRTFPDAIETTPLPSRSVTPAPVDRTATRRPSLPMLQTSFVSPPRKQITEREKPLPTAPTMPVQEISCHRCYYFAARNCNGWVLGGHHGDACEQCLQAGFFGAP